AREELLAKDPEKAVEQQAKETFGGSAAELFGAISTLPPSLDRNKIEPIAALYKKCVEMPPLPNAPVFAEAAATKSIEERPPRTFKGWYRFQYGIDPRDHVARILK